MKDLATKRNLPSVARSFGNAQDDKVSAALNFPNPYNIWQPATGRQMAGWRRPLGISERKNFTFFYQHSAVGNRQYKGVLVWWQEQ
jgi:hypothetical protein